MLVASSNVGFRYDAQPHQSTQSELSLVATRFFTMPGASDLVPIREYSPFPLLIYRFGITYIVTSLNKLRPK